jgi:hypothetical protein
VPTQKKTIKVQETTTDKVLVVKATKPLSKSEFELLSNLVKAEEAKTGIKVVLLPYSADLKEVKGDADSSKTSAKDNE